MSLRRYLPFLVWLPRYQRGDLPGDVLAGMTVAILLIPQSMAYATLAGLPPVIGLYASIVPVAVYGLLGTTRVLTLGPTAITSVMVLSTLSGLPGGDPATLALTLALCLGVVYLVTGFFGLGFIVNLLSLPVLLGYVNAAALVIIFSQISNLLGVDAPRTSQPYQLLLQPLTQLAHLNPVTLALGVGGIGVILGFRGPLNRWLNGKTPDLLRFTVTRSGPLVVVLVSLLLVGGLRLDERYGVAILGEIPSGLPVLQWGPFDFAHLDVLFTGALAIAFVGFMEGMSTAKSLLVQRRERIDANQELIAMGAANIASALTGGYAVTTSISRSAVNYTAGARTGLSSVIAAALLALVVALFTPVFFYLPQAALAAIIITSVVNLIDFSPVWQLARFSQAETVPFFLTFGAVFVTRIEIAILIGVGLMMLLHFLRTSRPRVAFLEREGYSQHYREAEPDVTTPIPQTLIVRIDESLYFANAQSLDNRLRNAVADRPNLEYLILDCAAINEIDASALQILVALVDDLARLNITVYLAQAKLHVRLRLESAHFVRSLGDDRIFPTVHDAVQQTGKLPDEMLPI